MINKVFVLFLPSNLLFLFTRGDWKGVYLQFHKAAYLHPLSGLPVRMANLSLCCSRHLTLSPLSDKPSSHLAQLWARPLILHHLCRNSIQRVMDTILFRLQSPSLSVCTQRSLRASLSSLPHLHRAWDACCSSHWTSEGFLKAREKKKMHFSVSGQERVRDSPGKLQITWYCVYLTWNDPKLVLQQ